jgi:hypothetical protein
LPTYQPQRVFSWHSNNKAFCLVTAKSKTFCTCLFNFFQESFIASAQQYAQVTELSQRVGEWEEKILPKLEREVSLTIGQ